MNKKGFTMLELLWVIVIIGFLTAMIAPRLGGVSERAEESINEANLKDTKKYVETFQDENAGDFPNHLINLVLADDDGIAAAVGDCIMATVEDRTNQVMESISYDFSDRLLLSEHVLSANEAAELLAMGVSVVLSWNHPDDPNYVSATHWNRYDWVDVAAGVMVVMIGGGAADSAVDITAHGDFDALGEEIGNPDWLYRIVAGIGPDCELVTEDYVEAAPLCPAGLNNRHYFYNYYSIVLPRLAATVNGRFGALPFDDDDGDGYLDFDVIDASDTTDGQIKRIQLKPMTGTQFDICNATGHGRQEDVKWWQLYDNGDGL
ncbi:MAG: hypothetical protein DRH17_02210 [Deltaproteobacteria bacterium]|nr:MAG: hypothetical protein DRH17_02210 [Deltaproteobacteria bacterium]